MTHAPVIRTAMDRCPLNVSPWEKQSLCEHREVFFSGGIIKPGKEATPVSFLF